jgi:hypothetical protein
VQLISNNITVRGTIIDAFSTTGSFPFKTDDFDVTGTNIAITGSVIFNGDDAIAVQSGSRNELFQYGTIGYQTHGMSIGLGLAQNISWRRIPRLQRLVPGVRGAGLHEPGLGVDTA